MAARAAPVARRRDAIPPLLAVMLAAACDVHGEVGQTDPFGGLGDQSLVAYYKLDETQGPRLADASGNGHDANAGGEIRFVRGRYGYGVAFDGAGWIEAPESDTAFDLTTQFTLAAWVRPDALQGMGGIIGKGSSPASRSYYLATSGSALEIGWNDARQKVSVRGGVLEPGVWVHVAATVDSALNTSLFVAGQLVSMAKASSTPGIGGAPLGIGRLDGTDGGTGTGLFHGAIDEVRIYSSALVRRDIPPLGGSGVNVPPEITRAATAKSYTPKKGEAVGFEIGAADADRDPLSYSWDFGDGTSISTGAGQAGHAFAQTGIFVVWPRVSDGHNPPVRGNPVSVAVGMDTTPPAFGLLADWRFEAAPAGLVADQSGHRHDAQFGDPATIVLDPMRSSSVIRLDGIAGNGTVAVANDLTLAGEITIAAWIQPTRSGPYGILRKEADPAAGSGGDELAFGVRDDRLEMTLGGDPASSLLGGEIRVGYWNHVAVTIDGAGRITLYLNGSLVGTGQAPVAVTARAAPLGIGRLAGADTLFAGDLDDVRIYGYALSPKEILQLSTTIILID